MTTTNTDPDECIGAIAQLLHHASISVAQRAAEAGPDSPLHELVLSVVLARGAAAALLPGTWEVEELEEEDRSILELLAAAEELTWPLPHPDFAHADLALDLCDLIRQARDLGC